MTDNPFPRTSAIEANLETIPPMIRELSFKGVEVLYIFSHRGVPKGYSAIINGRFVAGLGEVNGPDKVWGVEDLKAGLEKLYDYFGLEYESED